MNGDLAALLRRCLVHVAVGADEDVAGSGVWVAPRLVLTCAHVVQPAPGRTVTITWDGRRLAGEVLEWAPDHDAEGGLWPYPDIAVVNVPDAPSHPCVWLTEQPPVIEARLLALGHSDVYGAGQVTSARGRFGGIQTLHGVELWRLTGDEIAPGMSGGPVLDLDQGAVCGLVKTTREAGTSLGGLVLPVHGLRALPGTRGARVWLGHDRYHAADAGWSERRAARGSTCTVAEEADLLGLLAELDAVPDLDRRYAEAIALSPRPPDRPLLLARDAFTALADRFAQPGELHPVLRFTAGLAVDGTPADVAARIREWTIRVASRRDEYQLLEFARPARQASPSGTITVQIEPSAVDPARFGLTIWVDSGAGNVKVYCDDRAVRSLDEVRSELVEQLRRILVHGAALVEFVTPVALFEEGFEALSPTRRWTQLGRTNPVVLRDLERLRDTETWSEWRERWNELRAGGRAGVPTWLGCTETPSAEEFDGRLRARPDLAMLALPRTPADELLEVALYAGVPVLIWRRHSCAEHELSAPAGPCSGDRFRLAVDAALHEQSSVPLPELVRRLRSAAAEDADHDCRGIVLLWDDPYRLPEPTAPLRPPR